MKPTQILTTSPQQTLALAGRLARALKGGEIIFLRGPIGAGKTVFVKGVAAALGLKSSPTSASFSLIKSYQNKKYHLFHIDLFRLEENEVFNLGFEEMLQDEQAVILAEWPDPVCRILPQERLELNFILRGGDARVMEVTATGPQAQRLQEALCNEKKK